MYLVYEQHIIRLEIGQQRGEIARTLQHRTGSVAQVYAHLARDDVRQRGLAQPRRAEQQHVIERLFSSPRRLDEDGKLSAYFFLPDIFVQMFGAQGALQRLLLMRCWRGRDEARFGGEVIAVDHASSFICCDSDC